MRTSSSNIIIFFVFSVFLFSSLASYPIQVKWNVQTTQTSTGPELGGDNVFAVSDAGEILAMNKLDGRTAWTADLDRKVSFSPLFHNNLLYVGAEDGLYAFNSAGNPVGNVSFNSSVSGSPFLSENSIIVITRDGTIYVLSSSASLSRSNIIRTIRLSGETESSVYLYDKKLYIALLNGKIFSVDPATGSVVSLYDLGFSVWRSSPIVLNNTLYFASEHNLFGLTLQGKLTMSKQISNGNLNSLSTDGERIYAGSDDGYLYAVNPDGSVEWKYKTNNSVRTKPLILGDSIYFGSRDNNIYNLHKNGSLKWNITLSDWPSELVQSGGIIYSIAYDGKVNAISTLGCEIMNPEANSTVFARLSIAGNAIADNGIKSVEVRTLPGEWQTVSTSESWSNIVQITGFSEGPITVQCRVTDNAGNSEIAPYDTKAYTFVFSEEKLPKINVSYPSSVNVKQPIAFNFFNEQGTVLTGVTVTIAGEKFKVDDPTGQFTYTPQTEGVLPVLIEKSNYQSRQLEIKVTKPLIQPIYIAALLAAAVIVVVYTSMKKGTWR